MNRKIACYFALLLILGVLALTIPRAYVNYVRAHHRHAKVLSHAPYSPHLQQAYLPIFPQIDGYHFSGICFSEAYCDITTEGYELLIPFSFPGGSGYAVYTPD